MKTFIASFLLLSFLSCASHKNDLTICIEETPDTCDQNAIFLQEWIKEYDELYGINLTFLQLMLLFIVWDNLRKPAKDKP